MLRGTTTGGCLALGVLLGSLVLPGEAWAAKVLPPTVTLELALTYLNSAQGAHLPEAAAEVKGALETLGGPSVSRKLPSPPGGLYVLYNRHLVKQAERLLLVAEKQLLARGGMRDKQAAQQVRKALREVEDFLLLPFIF